MRLMLFIFITNDNIHHEFDRFCHANLHIAKPACMLPDIVKVRLFSFAVIGYGFTNIIGRLMLQMAGVYFNHFVKHTFCMIAALHFYNGQRLLLLY